MIARPMNYLIYNGKSIADFNAYISGGGTFSSPEVAYEVVEIPGRNGDLILGGDRYKNVTVSYESWILEDFEESIRNLRNFFLANPGYHRLEDTYHPDEYRMALYAGPFDPEVLYLSAANFTMEFNCRPQRYLKDGEVPRDYTENGTIYNPTFFNSKPILRVFGKGVLTIGDYTVTISSESEYDYINIDCDNMECFNGTNNCNALVSINHLDFPILPPGETEIALGEGITEIKIWPRWWML